MSITTVTRLHAAPGRDSDLEELVILGRDRMRAADGCESFDVLRDEADSCAFVFLQRWATHEAHDRAFAELIVRTGHLAKVLAVVDVPIDQHTYQVAT